MGNPRPKQEHLAQKLLQIRKKLDISQDRMPERLGRTDLHPGRISEYEKNKREPVLSVLMAYARLARIHLEYIVDDNVPLPDKIPGDVEYPLTPQDDHSSKKD